jgi:hypothetical protein
VGEWDKVLKRIYRYAALGRVRLFRRRALRDLLTYPRLADRIADYMRATGTVTEYLSFANAAWNHDEQVYPDVNVKLIESLIRLEPNQDELKPLRELAVDILDGKWKRPGSILCMQVAPLLLLRFADRRSAIRLRTFIRKRTDAAQSTVIRACAIVYASYGVKEFREMRKAAAQMWLNPLAEMVRLIERIRKYKQVPGSYAQRLNTSFDAVTGRPYIDMRSLLVARLLSLNSRTSVQKWLAQKKASLTKGMISAFDRNLMTKHLP